MANLNTDEGYLADGEADNADREAEIIEGIAEVAVTVNAHSLWELQPTNEIILAFGKDLDSILQNDRLKNLENELDDLEVERLELTKDQIQIKHQLKRFRDGQAMDSQCFHPRARAVQLTQVREAIEQVEDDMDDLWASLMRTKREVDNSERKHLDKVKDVDFSIFMQQCLRYANREAKKHELLRTSNNLEELVVQKVEKKKDEMIAVWQEIIQLETSGTVGIIRDRLEKCADRLNELFAPWDRRGDL